MIGKVIVIVGQGSGLTTLVEKLVEDGSHVFVGTPSNKAVKLSSSDRLHVLETDLTSYEAVVRSFQLAWNTHKRVDTIISYLPEGSSPISPSTGLIPSTMSPDLNVPMWCTRLAVNYFFETRFSKGKGKDELPAAGMESAGAKAGSYVIVGPEIPEVGKDVEAVKAAQANALLGLVRSLTGQATAEGFGLSLICTPAGVDEVTLYEGIRQACGRPFTTDFLENGKVYVLVGGVWKGLDTLQGQLYDMDHLRRLVYRLGVGQEFFAGLKRYLRSQSIIFKQYGPIISLLGLAALGSTFWFGSKGVKNWMLFVGGYLVVKSVTAKVMGGGRKSSKPVAARKKDGDQASVGVFLGSGGHTGEALQLLSALDPTRYTRRTYIHCTGDAMSVTKAVMFESTLEQPAHSEASNTPPYTFIELPRARKVAQPLWSSAFTTLYSLLFAVWTFTVLPIMQGSRRKPMFDVLLVNGPGTCVVVVAAFLMARTLGSATPKIIYVESFARVKSLSMSGKILKRFVDRFIVQWDAESPGAEVKGKTLTKLGENHGWLV